MFQRLKNILIGKPLTHDDSVQKQVKALQDYISQHFYPCDQTVLAGLGQMYQTDNYLNNNLVIFQTIKKRLLNN